MKNKIGFTLVELLAVIAILAILVIIALPNIMGMFNNAKKNTFETEIKKIYRGAEQAYVSDAFDGSGSKIYSKCKSGCNKPLDMSIRDDLEYYIEINSSGKVIKYYARDNSYQFKKDGEMSINDIKDVQTIADLEEDELVVISNNTASGGCSAHLIATEGSFSEDPNDKKICINIVDDGYVHETYYFNSTPSNNIYIQLPFHYEDFSNDSYIKVYEDNTKTNLIRTFTRNDFKPERFSLSEIRFINDEYTTYYLGEYVHNRIYVEASDDLIGNESTTLARCSSAECTTYYESITYRIYHLNEGVIVSRYGPWITDQETMDKIRYYISKNGRFFNAVNCEYDENNNEVCGNDYYIEHFEVTY